ncbi:APC family permease [Rhodococcus sp. ARC_M6]|uniref:APC family permease n=1 Tax=Rhodococcus sp. ARC_M6 TaxID=2928852 RepID=UPI001FB51A50|nr:APC family permease [Rhodococcus sp. ARC_M6]MCJ0906408.1 APC family permease [Rhodococcus sp. ARC_M6]
MAVTAALRAAIVRAQSADQDCDPVYSPLRGLGRRRLTPIDLLGQSLSTIAPATGMVFIAFWMITYSPGYVGLVAIAATTSAVFLVALCITHFTRRLAAAGSLYSFVFQGSGTKAALAAGTALVLGYLGISVSVFSQAVPSLLDTISIVGPQLEGPVPAGIVTILIAGTVAWIAVRGVRFATRAILVVEACSLILIIAVMLATRTDTATTVALPNPSLSAVPFLAMLTVLSMAGFESAAFFGPESKRPLITVTRTVLISPIICGVLFVFAAWAAMTGHGATIVGAYFEGTASGAGPGVVLAVKIGMTCSWLACTLGCAQAGSRLLYSMGVERVLPSSLARMHRRFRTPYVAVIAFVSVSTVGVLVFSDAVRDDSGFFDGVVETALVCAYTLVAFASWKFLRRIGEHTWPTRLCALSVSAAGAGLLVYIVVDGVAHGVWVLVIAVATVAASGTIWSAILRRVRPESLRAVGAFDSIETVDLLPGTGTLLIDGDGRPHLVPDRSVFGNGLPEQRE